jgi:hypothetical protein
MTISASDGCQVRSERGKRAGGKVETDPYSSEPVVAASVSGARPAHYLRRRQSPQRFPDAYAPRGAALEEAENRDEVYPRLALRRKPGPLADGSGGNAHRAGDPAGEGENGGSKVKTSVRAVSLGWRCGWASSERGTANAPCASMVG